MSTTADLLNRAAERLETDEVHLTVVMLGRNSRPANAREIQHSLAELLRHEARTGNDIFDGYDPFVAVAWAILGD